MSAGLSAAAGVERECGECGEVFVDRSRTAPRSYCYVCRPLRSRPSEVVVARRVRGKPFTVAHFRAWTRQLELKDGSRFLLERWEEAFVADVFAGFKECWLIVPEGNGKSTLIAVLILYCCEFSGEASIPVAASARDQAEIIFQQAQGFVRRSPGLRSRFVCKPGLREIVFDRVSRAKIFASDAGTGDGIIPWPLEVLDELHRHPTLDLYRTWAGKLDKEGAQLVVISTAGAPGSEFEETRERMRQEAVDVSRDGCFGRYVGSTSVLHEYAVPEGGDVEDLELVKAANPSVRITVETLSAKRSRPSWNLGHWRRLTCNLPTRDAYAAITEAEWFDAAVDPGMWPDRKPIVAGLDLGWRYDTTALVPLWWRDPEFRLLGPACELVPPRDGAMLEIAEVQNAIFELHQRNPIERLVMDMHHGEDLAQWVSNELGITVIDRGQSSKFKALDYQKFMEALRNGWLKHTGDPVLRRHVLNAVAVRLPLGDLRFDRPARSRHAPLQDVRVIDALDAASIVHTVLATTPAPTTTYLL